MLKGNEVPNEYYRGNICPSCGIRERKIRASGKQSGYCRICEVLYFREKRRKLKELKGGEQNMPKLIKDLDEEESDENDKDEEEVSYDDEEEDEQPKQRQEKSRQEERREVKRRFMIAAPQPLRIIDSESKEIIGEGEYAILQALTELIERVERIENALGNMTER